MDNADFYFAKAELDFRKERARNGWRAVRRSRKRKSEAQPIGRALGAEDETRH